MAQTKVKLISDGVIVQSNLHASHGITTAHIGEGSNLYYTDARVGSYLSTNSFATESYVGTQITNLVDSSPATLNTLNELAAALGDDPNFATTTATSIGLKAPLASPSFTGNATFAGNVGVGLTADSNIALFIKANGNTYSTGNIVLEDADSTTKSAITHVNGGLYLSHDASTDDLALTSGNATFAGTVQTTQITATNGLNYLKRNTDASLQLRSENTRSGLFITKPATDTVMGSALVLASDESYRLGTASYYHMVMLQNGNTYFNQKVGIGTTVPGRKLTVTGNASGDANNLLLANENDTDGDSASIGFSMLSNNTYVKSGIFFKRTTTQGRGDLIFANNNEVNGNNVTLSDAKMTIQPSGNVGIGQTNPQFGLSMAQGTGDGNRIGWNDGAGDKRASIICSSSTDALQFHAGTSDTERMRIGSSGIMYIMGATPSANNSLQLQYNSTAGTAEIYSKSTGGSTSFEFYTSSSGTTTPKFTIGSSGDVRMTTNGKFLQGIRNTGSAAIDMIGFVSGTDTLQIKGGTSGAANAISFYDTGGFIGTWYNSNFGIGTTSPQQPLHVQSAGDLFTRYQANSNVNGVQFQTWHGNSQTMTINSNTTNPFAVYVGSASGTIAINVDSNANVGIGTTTPNAKLEIATLRQPGIRLSSLDTTAATNELLSGIEFYTADISAPRVSSYINCNFASAYGDSYLTFATSTGVGAATEKMRIRNDGIILISRTNLDISTQTGYRLDPNGEAYASIDGTAGTNAWHVYDMNSNNYRFFVSGAGQIHATSTSISAISDVTLKENIKPLETGLSEVMKLQPRRFDWKNGDGKNIAGFVAQEVADVLPDLVDDYKYNDEETKKSLKMGDMIPTLVKAIQELKAEIETLKTQING